MLNCISTKVTAIAWVSNRIKCFGDQRFSSVVVLHLLLHVANVMYGAHIFQCVLLTSKLLLYQLLSPIPGLHLALFPV